MRFDEGLIQSVLSLFNENVCENDDEILRILRLGDYIGNGELIAAIRSIILDNTTSFAQKLRKYVMQGRTPENDSIEIFQKIWRIISEGQPWPLDEAKK